MSFGVAPLGSSFYGGLGPFSLIDSKSTSTTLVTLTFSEPFLADSSVSDVGNYIVPGLDILRVLPDSDSSKVRLLTSSQSYQEYSVAVSNIKNSYGLDLDPLGNTSTFTGWPGAPLFSAKALSATAIELLFNLPMALEGAIQDPLSYSIRDFSGTFIPVLSVAVRSSGKVRLNLGARLTSSTTYVVQLSNQVKTTQGLEVIPNTALAAWTFRSLTTSVPISGFTGEVKASREGDPQPPVGLPESTRALFGRPDGQVFFSPSLIPGGSGSTILVDQVKTCTRAYDVYTLPQPPVRGRALSTFGGGYISRIGRDTLNPKGGVGKEVSHILTTLNQETVEPTTDSGVDAVLTQVYDPDRFSLLNNPGWRTFGGSGRPFKTADNSAPLGPPVVISSGHIG